MIRIEDQEDVAAYREARREIDDEFDEQKAMAEDPTNADPSIATNALEQAPTTELLADAV